ncbi:MAG: hypothetical protein ACI841_005387 [Planctomycetota bacterium]|jgi:hypothetical protein
MTARILLTSFATLLAGSSTAHAQLKVDFNSLTQDGGPHPELGYESYDAGHEVQADFVPKIFTADFGSGLVNITVTPAWPNSADNRVMQSIDRSSGNDAYWIGSNQDLLTDWIGTDTRTLSGGNGDWFRTSGTPTYLTLRLNGLSANEYSWLSYHHDTENIWSDFQVEVSTDGGATFGPPVDMEMTSSSPGGNPADPVKETGSPDPDPEHLTSTFTTSFVADGSADVVLRFAPFADGVDGIEVHKRIFGMNAFEIGSSLGVTYCVLSLNSAGPGTSISASGSSSISANNLVLHASQTTNQPGIFIYGPTQQLTPFGNGVLCVATPRYYLWPARTAVQNQAARAVDHAAPPAGGIITVGSTFHFQYWHRDPAAGGAAYNTSDGLTLTFTP